MPEEHGITTFSGMYAPKGNREIPAKLSMLIMRISALRKKLQTEFTKAASTRFGLWLGVVCQSMATLKIGSTPNQDNPLMKISTSKEQSLLGLDVWEHAYYLKYQKLQSRLYQQLVSGSQLGFCSQTAIVYLPYQHTAKEDFFSGFLFSASKDKK